MKNRHLIGLIGVLIVLGLTIFAYRLWYLQVPLLPGQTQDSWTVEANLQFNATTNPISAQFYIPRNPPNYSLLDEQFISRGYGVTTALENGNQLATWSIRRARGQQSIYYRAIFYRNTLNQPLSGLKVPSVTPAEFSDAQMPALEAIIAQTRSRSSNVRTFATEALKLLNDATDDNAKLLLQRDTSADNIAKTAIDVLSHANIPAMLTYSVSLQTQKNATFIPGLFIHNGQEWIYYDPLTGQTGLPNHLLVWYYGDNAASAINQGGAQMQFSIAVTAAPINALELVEQRGIEMQSTLMRFSPFSLPLRTQQIYLILLTVPIGAFVILLLRNYIGLTTFGTFMPVLIALAFRETQLLTGIFLFSLITAMGLAVRFYLDQLKLLLMPRLTAILIVVIIIMLAISILGFQLNLEKGLSIALFPMVILTMVIERMCIVWDERGASEAILSGVGSLVAASIAYVVMKNIYIEYLFFAFPELLLVLLGFTFWCGQYRGYRLTELYRFKSFLKRDNG
jgi:hypothetical protein